MKRRAKGSLCHMAFIMLIPLLILHSSFSNRFASAFVVVVKQTQSCDSNNGDFIHRLRRRRQILFSSSLPEPERKQRIKKNSFKTLSLGVWLAFGILTTPTQHAHAGFGPSSGATTSATPGLSLIKVQEQDIQKQRKLQQIIGSTIDERRLEEFSAQLDTVIEEIRLRQSNPDTTSNPAHEQSDDNVLLDEAEELRNRIFEREQLLEKLEAQPYWFNYLAAFIGSVVSTLVMHPIDSIKTRLQVQPVAADPEMIWMQHNVTMAFNHTDDDDDPLYSSRQPHTIANPRSQTIMNGSATEHDAFSTTTTTMVLERPIQAVTTTATNTTALRVSHNDTRNYSLFSGLYKGLAGNIAKEGPPSALYLGVYETAKLQLSAQFTRPEYLLGVYLVSGALGELVGSVVRAPAEAVKTLVQSSNDNVTTKDATIQVLGTPKGRANAVRAWSASVWRDVPFGAIQLAIFELVKAYILNNPNIVDFDSSTLSAEAIIGAFAGACGAFLTTPADVVTTRIITQETTLGVFEMAMQIYHEGGLSAFFNGWQARVGYWAPSISIFLTCYCSVRQAGVRFDLFG